MSVISLPVQSICPRCNTLCVRYDRNESRFEIVTKAPHTPARCERLRIQSTKEV
jgi:hypothetical protein